MIDINLYGVPKSSENGGTTIVNGKGGMTDVTNLFEPHYLWGQYFDDTQDINGDMTVDGHIQANTIEAEDINVTNELNAIRGIFNELTAGTGNIENLSGDSLNYRLATLMQAYISQLEADDITTKNLTVTGTAHFFELIIDKLRASGGAYIFTPADGFKIDKVEAISGGYRLYFKSTDNERHIWNMWRPQDQAICRSFNQAQPGTSYNISNKYYWTLVTNTNVEDTGGAPVEVNFGTTEEPDIVPCHYIDISTSVYDGVVDPEVGDEIVMLGYRGNDDPQRQSAIYIAAYSSIDRDLVAPLWCQYRGINDFDLDSHKYTWFSAAGLNGYHANQIQGSTKLESGVTIEEYIQQREKTIIFYTLISPTNAVTIDKSLTYTPSTITFTIIKNTDGTLEELNTVPANYTVKVYSDLSGNTPIYTFTAGATIAFNTPKTEGIKYIRVILSNDNVIADSRTISYIEYGADGIEGGHYEFRYQNAKTKPTKPANTSSGLSGGWTNTASTPDYANGYFTWMTQCYVSGSGTYGTWSDPIRITGDNGKDGEDGNTIEFIYTRTQSSSTPATPTTSQEDDYIPRNWTDNPSGVTSVYKYEWVSTRTKESGVWSEYSTPAIWSKWGEKGMDGDGFEYIYKLSNTKPTTPATSQTDDYIPSGWNDEPQSVSDANPIQWVCMRKKHDGTWGDFTDPVIWTRYAPAGTNGGHYEFRYKNAKTKPSRPTADQDADSSWSNTPSTPDFVNGYYTWMTQCYVTGNNVFGTWSDPIRITGDNGKDGEDGTKIEFIYKRTNNNAQPATPATSQTDDYIPSGWTDNPTGVTSSNMYEWVCTRSKDNGTWSQYSTPAIWSKWGEKGMDGDGYEYIFILSLEQPETPATSQTDDYVPSGWSDDPLDLTEENSIEWVSVRKKENGTWGSFSTPAIWAHWAPAGQNGGHYEFRYQNAKTKPTKPANASSGLTGGWTRTASTPDFANGYYTWMTNTLVNGNGQYGTWSDPIRMTGDNGKDGEDGTKTEFIYATSTTTTTPAITYGEWNSKNRNDDDYVPRNWTDNPTGVTAAKMYEFVATRTKEDNIWSDFSTPAIWSKWGEKGQDGDGYEYIYILSATEPTISYTPNASGRPADDEFVPDNWSDDPLELSATNQLEWVAVRKKHNGTWGNFSEPQIWAHWAQPGTNGSHYEFRYQNKKTKPAKPADNSDGTTGGWSATMTEPDYAGGYFTWMTQCVVGGSGGYGVWTTPIRITGKDGKDGEDGTDIEFIYLRNNTSNRPATPATSQTDDYIPSGWTDNPQGVTSSNMYEWVCTRSKENGTWSAYSTPAIWSKWGEKGMDGDGYEYIYQLNISQPTTPATSQTDDYVPSGWSDDPLELSQENPIEWVCVRKKHNGIWGNYSEPQVWAHWTTKGSDGGTWTFRYQNAKTKPATPTANRNTSAPWTTNPSTPDFANGYYTWMTQCFCPSVGTYTTWTEPIRLTGDNGRDGEDGTQTEFVYKRSTDNNVTSNDISYNKYNNKTRDDDDFLPGAGWTDNPTGVDATYKYEYVATRSKENGTWGDFSTPAIWSKWGEKGQDGDGYEYIYCLSNTTPTKPSSPQQDEYHPSPWSDDPQEPNSTLQYCWVIKRKKHNGVWGSWSNPVVWSHYIDISDLDIDVQDGKDYEGYHLIDNGSYCIVTVQSGSRKVNININYRIAHQIGADITLLDVSTNPTASSFTVRYKLNTWSTTQNATIGNDGVASKTGTADYIGTMTTLKVELVKNNIVWDTAILNVVMKPDAILDITDSIYATVQGHDESLNTLRNSYSELSMEYDNISSKVETNTADIDELSGEVESFSSSISQITQLADNISSIVQTYGGVQLIDQMAWTNNDRTRATYDTSNHSLVFAYKGGAYKLYSNTIRLKAGEKYTFSIYYASTIGVTIYYSSSNVAGQRMYNTVSTSTKTISDDTWAGTPRHKYTFTAPSNAFISVCLSSSGPYYVYCPQLEIGEEATMFDFSTATMTSSISQTADEILLQVSGCGIDVKNNQITLNGNTEVVGNLTLTESDQGFILQGDGGTTLITPQSIGTYNDFISKTNITHKVELSQSARDPNLIFEYKLGYLKNNTSIALSSQDAELYHDYVSGGTQISSTVTVTHKLMRGNTQVDSITNSVNYKQTVGTFTTNANGEYTIRTEINWSTSSSYQNLLFMLWYDAKVAITDVFTMVGYDGIGMNFSNNNTVYIGTEGTIIKYGNMNALKVDSNGVMIANPNVSGDTQWSLMSTQNVTLMPDSDYRIQWYDEFIIARNMSANRTIDLIGSQYPGRKIIIKNASSYRTLTVSAPSKMIRSDKGMTTVNNDVSISDNKPRMFIYDGDYWYEMFLGN